MTIQLTADQCQEAGGDIAPRQAKRSALHVLRLARMPSVFGLLCVLLWAAAVTITAKAADLQVIADFPVGTGPFPTVVLAPGQGYHMRLPVLARTAKALVDQGIAVYRFDWTYFSREPKGEPSSDLSAELQDMQQAISLARSDKRVDGDRISVGGKSLGSLVAWRAMAADPGIASAALLTPVCNQRVIPGSSPASFADINYPGIQSEARPVLFVMGDADPLCDVKALLRFAAATAGPVRVTIVGGDHGFNDPRAPRQRRDLAAAQTIDDAARAVTRFVEEYAGQKGR